MKFLFLMRIVALFFILIFPFHTIAQENPNPERYYFSKEGRELFIEQFINWDKKNSFSKGGILFVGSSSIRLWPTSKYFKGNIINRGFGGSHLSDIIYYFDHIVEKYAPKTILLYAGDNDIADNKSPEKVLDDFIEFTTLVNDKIAHCALVFIPIKPSPSRWKYWPKMKMTNDLIKLYVRDYDNLYYLDTATPMIGENGRPIPNLFVSDSLHLSTKGYDLWSSIANSFLDSTSAEDNSLKITLEYIKNMFK